MSQTRTHSLIEICLSTLSGFLLAMLVWAYVIPIIYPRMEGPITENMVITLIFTVLSILRGYFWRRLFNKKPKSKNIN